MPEGATAEIEQLKDLSKPRIAAFGESDLDDHGIELISKLTQLRELQIEMSAVTAAGLAPLANCKHLQTLHCGPFDNSGVAMQQLGGFTNLKSLTLYSFPTAEDDFQFFGRMKNLQVLVLKGNTTSGCGLSRLRGLSNLHKLQLQNDSLSDDAMQGVGEQTQLHILTLAQLETLTLSQCPVSTKCIEALSCQASLKWLDISETSVDDTLATALKPFRELTYLNVRKTHLTRAGFAMLDKVLPEKCKLYSDFADGT